VSEIERWVEEKRDAPVARRDALGNFLQITYFYGGGGIRTLGAP
jgi:hypothetical protein